MKLIVPWMKDEGIGIRSVHDAGLEEGAKAKEVALYIEEKAKKQRGSSLAENCIGCVNA
jgi:hypothetical protein